MKKLYFFLILTFCSSTLFAQLPDGATAPNFTLPDFQTGVMYDLYDILDEGKPVMLDFSATWCGPCWNYHNTHIFADMFNEYGPQGTDEAFAFYMEADPSTNDFCIIGDDANCNSSTWGDWTVDTPYPIVNPDNANVRNAYQIGYWPTLYAVAPNRQVFEVGQAAKAVWESWLFTSFALAETHTTTDVQCVGQVGGGGLIDLDISDGFGTISFLWSNGETTEDLMDAVPGTYTCTITEGRGYSIVTDEITITGPAEALSAEVDSESPSCNGDVGLASVSADGGVGNYSYLWSTGETTSAISGLTTGVYDVVVTDGNGCEILKSIEIIEPEEVTEFVQSFPATCDETNGLLIIQAQGGTPPFTYYNGIDYNTTGNFGSLTAGAYECEVTDANGCNISFTTFVVLINPPIAVAEAPNSVDCNNVQVLLSGEGSTEGNNFTYNWVTTDGEIIEGGTTLNPLVQGVGTYTLEVWDVVYNCIVSTDVFVEGNFDSPTADAGESMDLTCDVVEVQLNGMNSSSGDDFTYNWTTTNGNIVGGADTQTPTVNAGGTYQIEVTNNTNGCYSFAIVEVSQSVDVPVSNAGGTMELTCANTSLELNGAGSSEGADVEYTWSTIDGNIVSGESTLHPIIDQPGVYLLTVVNTTSGCEAISSVEIGENVVAPEGSIAAPEVLTCELAQFNLQAELPDGDYSYVWTTSGGNILTGADSESPVIDAPGTYLVVYTDLATGCSGEASVIVEQSINTPMAAYEFSNEDNVFTFADQSEGSPTSYLWEFGDGNSSTEANPIHEYIDDGTYEVCLTITNECGDNKTCSTVVVLSGSSLSFTEEIVNPTCFETCNGEYSITTIEETSNYSLVISGPNGYTSADQFTVSDLCPGEYTLVLTNELNETVESTFNVIEPAELSVDESLVNHLDCANTANGSISIVISGGTGVLIASWSNGAEGLDISNLDGGQYSVDLTDENGCTKTFNFVIDEPTELKLEDKVITNIDDTTPTGSIDITIEGGTPGYTYLWAHGETTEDVTDLAIGEYTVIVTDENGCSDEYGPFEIQNLVAVHEIEGLELFEVNPNPTNGDIALTLEFEQSNRAEISILNNIGPIMQSKTLTGKNINQSYDISEYAAGMYFVRIVVEDTLVIKKIIKK